MRRLIVSLCALALTAAGAMGQTYSRELEAKAAKGDLNAQYDLAVCYQRGLNVAADGKKAFEWFKKAAEKGSIYAQQSLGDCYFRALGTPLNERLAFEWYEKAVNGGNTDALTPLGLCYYAGKGTGQDFVKAFNLFKQAAAEGSAEGKACLGWCYAAGGGNDSINHRRAMQLWSDISSSAEMRPTMLYLMGMFLMNHPGTGDAETVYAYFKAASEGPAPVGDAICKRSVMEECGLGTAQDKENAAVLKNAWQKGGFTNETGALLTASEPLITIDEKGVAYRREAQPVKTATGSFEGAKPGEAKNEAPPVPFEHKGNEARKKGGKGNATVGTFNVHESEREKVYDVVQMPQFPLGSGGLFLYLSSKINYPEEALKKNIQGRVVLTYVVERDGSISDIQVVKSVSPECDKEAIRVVGSMPKWIPAEQNGSKVRVRYTLPITFRL